MELHFNAVTNTATQLVSGGQAWRCTIRGKRVIEFRQLTTLNMLANFLPKAVPMELPTVFRLHSAFAAVCGGLAAFAPSFFGQVFPDLASPDTLAFIVRVYAVLLTAQAPLLYGIRQINSAPGLRPFCAVYALVFGGTAAVRSLRCRTPAHVPANPRGRAHSGLGTQVCAHSDLVLGVVREEQKNVLWLWIGLAAVYGGFAARPSPVLFRLWSIVHMSCVAGIGLAALYAPAAGNLRYFLVPSQEAYATVSRYYGVLILGMCLLAAAATREAARPAWPAVRLGLCAMFAASGGCLGTYLVERGELDFRVGAVGRRLTLGVRCDGCCLRHGAPSRATEEALTNSLDHCWSVS